MLLQRRIFFFCSQVFLTYSLKIRFIKMLASLFQSLRNIVLVMTGYLNRHRKWLKANYEPLRRILETVKKVHYSSAAQTGSRLEGRVRIKAWCFFSLNQENRKEPSIQCIQYASGLYVVTSDRSQMMDEAGKEGLRCEYFWEEDQGVCTCACACTRVFVGASMHMLWVNMLKHLTSQMLMFINSVTITCNFLLLSHKKWESDILEMLRLKGSCMLIGFLFLYPGQSSQLHLIKYNI